MAVGSFDGAPVFTDGNCQSIFKDSNFSEIAHVKFFSTPFLKSKVQNKECNSSDLKKVTLKKYKKIKTGKEKNEEKVKQVNNKNKTKRIRIENQKQGRCSLPLQKDIEPAHFPCAYCDEYFFKEQLLRRHLKLHSSSLELRRKESNSQNKTEQNYDLSKKSNFKSHVYTSSENYSEYSDGQRYFTCNSCHKSFKFRSHLIAHLKSHDKNLDKDFVCKICGKQYSTIKSFTKHKLEHDGGNTFKCVACHEAFSSKVDCRKHHHVVHKKSWKCNKCVRSFHQENALNDHMKYHENSIVKMYTCSLCLKEFKSKVNLKIHIESNCGTNPQHLCKTCGKVFMSRGSLFTHKHLHTGQKTFLCGFCGKSFYSKVEMERHERSHTGEKPFVCKVKECGKAFSHRESLVTHNTIHTGNKPYMCESCGSTFSCIGNLMKHRKTHRNKSTSSLPSMNSPDKRFSHVNKPEHSQLNCDPTSVQTQACKTQDFCQPSPEFGFAANICQGSNSRLELTSNYELTNKSIREPRYHEGWKSGKLGVFIEKKETTSNNYSVDATSTSSYSGQIVQTNINDSFSSAKSPYAQVSQNFSRNVTYDCGVHSANNSLFPENSVFESHVRMQNSFSQLSCQKSFNLFNNLKSQLFNSQNIRKSCCNNQTYNENPLSNNHFGIQTTFPQSYLQNLSEYVQNLKFHVPSMCENSSFEMKSEKHNFDNPANFNSLLAHKYNHQPNTNMQNYRDDESGVTTNTNNGNSTAPNDKQISDSAYNIEDELFDFVESYCLKNRQEKSLGLDNNECFENKYASNKDVLKTNNLNTEINKTVTVNKHIQNFESVNKIYNCHDLKFTEYNKAFDGKVENSHRTAVFSEKTCDHNDELMRNDRNSGINLLDKMLNEKEYGNDGSKNPQNNRQLDEEKVEYNLKRMKPDSVKAVKNSTQINMPLSSKTSPIENVTELNSKILNNCENENHDTCFNDSSKICNSSKKSKERNTETNINKCPKLLNTTISDNNIANKDDMILHKNSQNDELSYSIDSPNTGEPIECKIEIHEDVSNNVEYNNELGLRSEFKKKHLGKNYFCSLCDCSFVTAENLTRHMFKKHTKHSENFCVYQCEHCDKGFTMKADYDKHIIIHRKKEKCVKCNGHYLYLNLHMLKKHSETVAPLYSCHACGKVFKQKGNIKDHIDSYCGTKPRHVCAMCGKALISKGALKTHAMVHTGQKKFLCNYCGKSFRLKIQMQRHERSHTGEKPFSCKTCGKAFAHRESLTTHNTLHSGDRRYMCEECGKKFSCIGNLSKHRVTHQNVKNKTCNF